MKYKPKTSLVYYSSGIFVCLLLIFNLSCNSKDSYKSKIINPPDGKTKNELKSKLIGDWWVKINDQHDPYYFILSFADSTFRYMHEFNNINSFRWKDDSLMISFYARHNKNIPIWLGFVFYSISDSELTLGFDTEKNLHIKTNNILRFRKMMKDSSGKSLKMEKLEIIRSGCYGECPIFGFEINSNGKFYYQGLRYVDSIGTFTGMIDLNLMSLIREKLQLININQLKQEYITGTTDVETVFLTIMFRNKINNKSSVYKTYIEWGRGPVEIENLIIYLSKLPACLKMKRDEGKPRFFRKNYGYDMLQH